MAFILFSLKKIKIAKNNPEIVVRICSKFNRKWSKRTDCSKIVVNFGHKTRVRDLT